LRTHHGTRYLRAMKLLGLVLSVACAFVVSCGPSAAEIKTATGARYKGKVYDMFEDVLDAVKARYKVDAIDDDEYTIVTESRWYQYNGQAESHAGGEMYRVHDDSLEVALKVHLTKIEDSPDLVRLEVAPVVHRELLDPQRTVELAADDPKLPGWVHDKVNELWVALHHRLASYEMP